MNGYSPLEPTLRHILNVIYPTEQDWNVRFRILHELKSAIEPIENLRGCTVEPFGSFASDLFTRWGDLDISVELYNASYIVLPAKKLKLTLLADILKVLKKKAGFYRMQFISNARVPILKLEIRGISCDISIGNLSGQMKSKLLFWINSIDGRFRDLVLLVKEWAKRHHINESKSGTLNSYCLSLLVVFHLQTVAPAVLPPLREIYNGNMVDNLIGLRVDAERRIEEICADNIKRVKADKSRMINRSSLSELFVSFLAKFSDICSRAETHGISPYTGEWEAIDSNMSWLPKTYTLYVEDPFEQPANTSRTVSGKQLVKISEVIEATHSVLVSPNQPQANLATVLAGPHILRFFPAGPIPNPRIPNSVPRPRFNHNINGHKLTQPKSKNLPSQTQQSQNHIVDNGEKATTNGVNASSSQAQQVWRPK